MAQISHIYPPYIDSLDKPDFLFTSFAHHWFTSHFGIPLGTLPGSGNYLFSPRKLFSVPLSQHYACAMTFNMASGQGPGYWDNIMDPVGTRSWTRLGPGHGPGWDPVMVPVGTRSWSRFLGPGHGWMMKTLHCFTSISLSTLC